MMRDFTYLNHHQTTESELRPDQTSPDHNPQQLGKLLFPIYFMAGGCRVSERSTKNHPHGVNRREANCMAIKGIIVNSIIACRILAQMGYTPPLVPGRLLLLLLLYQTFNSRVGPHNKYIPEGDLILNVLISCYSSGGGQDPSQ